ncbi:MAG TPA: hypothetical protein VFG10_03340 [Saprospiraceae bacterium]|nr:hypothetical protein [Saprospiraceae bacterium]
MKKLMSKYPGTFIGVVFTYCSLVIHFTYILPYFFTSYAPLVFLMAYKGAGGTGEDDVVNMYTFICLILFFLMSSVMYYTVLIRPRMVEKLTFTFPLAGFMLLQLFLIHPILLYAITFADWYGDNNNVPVFKTNHTFWISSWAFIILGFVADVLRKKWVKRE